jgi:hypothetical protein
VNRYDALVACAETLIWAPPKKWKGCPGCAAARRQYGLYLAEKGIGVDPSDLEDNPIFCEYHEGNLQ